MSQKLSIIIPVFNESAYIHRCLQNVIQSNVQGWEKEIILVDDHSTDNTVHIAKEFEKENNSLKIITSSDHWGKGEMVRKGIQEAKGDIVIVQDADLEYDPADYAIILKQFKRNEINVVYGSRILGTHMYHNYSANIFFFIGGILLSKIVNVFFGTKLTDQATGYKSWRSTLSPGLLQYCKTKGFEFEIEMTSFFSQKVSIIEVPIHYYPRTVSHGKKIRLSDFMKSVYMVFLCRFMRKT